YIFHVCVTLRNLDLRLNPKYCMKNLLGYDGAMGYARNWFDINKVAY
ncbi:unnamed protein product, partial [Brassica rapa subsp. trilocularis]